MKYLFFITGLCALLFSCKKDAPLRNIEMQITGVNQATTQYNIHITNPANASPNIDLVNAISNQVVPFTVPSGSQLTITYNFTTQGDQFGQGYVRFIYGTDTLLKINGGFGTQNLNIP
jgi:hypothetical protein